MTLQIGNEKLNYHLAEAIRYSLDVDNTCHFRNNTNELVDDYKQELIHLDPFEW